MSGPFDEYVSTFRGCSILLQKASLEANWYIIVTAKDGGKLYEGYWPDSADEKSIAALAEAKRGSCLTK